MPQISFQEQPAPWRSAFRARDASPDSVILTFESNLSLFSSTSASAERCSFASDAHDHDLFTSEISLNLPGNDGGNQEFSSDPDPDPNPNKHAPGNKHSRLPRYGVKAKVKQEANNANIEDESQPSDSARNSFSLALKECQDRRSRSDALSRNRRRPASLDLNNVTASSPRLGTMKKSLATSRRSGAFPSPGTPNYSHASIGMQKGWSSERVPLHNSTSRKNVGTAFLPFNSGKTLPSKWEDAERWIFSPVSGDGVVRPSVSNPQRKPKSKSGPLGPPGTAYHSMFSPAMPTFTGGNVGKFFAGSPHSAGLITADGLSIQSGEHDRAFLVQSEPCIACSVSVHGCSQMLSQSSFTSSQAETLDGERNISRVVSRKDMATQMSPQDSNQSSPRIRLSTSASTPSALPNVELQDFSSSKLEVRDVQIDEQVTMTRWSKKNKSRIPRKGCVDDWRKKYKDAADSQSCAWDNSAMAKNASKINGEEAKIAAWENLQKAKAEAAIRKLEVKLEKKRLSSMDKIMNKLRAAQKKAQEMRSSMSANPAHQASRTSNKTLSFCRIRQMGSLSGCFTCHAS